MPLLIAALVVGWLTFFFKGEPPSHLTVPDISERIPNELDLGPMLSDGTADEPSERRKEMGAGQESKTAKILPPVPEGDTTEFSPATGFPRNELPLVSNDGVSESDFTPWMSPLALDTYIRQKNRGHTQSFWARGNWIVAIEGRWQFGRHEFRIVHDTIPDRARFEWYYRIDQTESEYRETLSRLRREGYRLVQSQAYERPDKTKRYQAVWHREIPAKTPLAGIPEL